MPRFMLRARVDFGGLFPEFIVMRAFSRVHRYKEKQSRNNVEDPAEYGLVTLVF